MPTYSDVKNATVGTSETLVGTFDVPMGAKLIGFRAWSATGTGHVTKVRFSISGIPEPQTYAAGLVPCQDGTAAGAGSQAAYCPVQPLDIPVPSSGGVKVYATANAASQDVYVQLIWVK